VPSGSHNAVAWCAETKVRLNQGNIHHAENDSSSYLIEAQRKKRELTDVVAVHAEAACRTTQAAIPSIPRRPLFLISGPKCGDPTPKNAT